MTNNFNQISVRFANEFENELYRLSKKYRNIRADVEPIIAKIQNSNFVGDRTHLHKQKLQVTMGN